MAFRYRITHIWYVINFNILLSLALNFDIVLDKSANEQIKEIITCVKIHEWSYSTEG